MSKKDDYTALAEVNAEPDVKTLRVAYERTLSDLGDYFDKCQRSFDDRRNWWPGKSRDLRKNGADAFPWKGASDTEAHVINERVNTLVAMCMTALSRANIQAYPVEVNDSSRARVVSSFLKWMTVSYIPHFKEEMEMAANYLFERAIIVTYVGWERENNKYLQTLKLEEIQKNAPDIAAAIVKGANDTDIIKLLKSNYPDLKDSKAKKALDDLRKRGVAELPVIRRKVDRPCVRALAPDEDVIFPSWCNDPQKAPYCFYRVRMTVQDVWNKVATSDWDEDWANELINKTRGIDTFVSQSPRSSTRRNITDIEAYDVVDVIYCYQRLFDRDDGSQGIYCTVFNPLIVASNKSRDYGKFELLNGLDEYPFKTTKLSEDTKRFYDVQTLPEMLRGIQNDVKVERDSRIDRNSQTTNPTLLHPPGKCPVDLGPGRKIARMRPNDYEYMATPAFNPGSVEIENTLLNTADKMVGLDYENPLSASRRQFLVDKFLNHVRDVIKGAFKAYQRWGPDQKFFQVTGVPDPMRFDKGDPDEDWNVIIGFDVQNTNPDSIEKKLGAIASIVPMDRNGRVNIDKYIEFMANAIDPMLADAILQPIEESQQKMVSDVTDDLTKIFAGIEVGARPNGAQMAMRIIQQYAQQPDIQQRLEGDKTFAERLQKYAAQYQFALQQSQNADIGKRGTAPAAVGSVTTQGSNTQTY